MDPYPQRVRGERQQEALQWQRWLAEREAEERQREIDRARDERERESLMRIGLKRAVHTVYNEYEGKKKRLLEDDVHNDNLSGRIGADWALAATLLSAAAGTVAGYAAGPVIAETAAACDVSITMQVARIAGAVVGGVLSAVGLGWMIGCKRGMETSSEFFPEDSQTKKRRKLAEMQADRDSRLHGIGEAELLEYACIHRQPSARVAVISGDLCSSECLSVSGPRNERKRTREEDEEDGSVSQWWKWW